MISLHNPAASTAQGGCLHLWGLPPPHTFPSTTPALHRLLLPLHTPASHITYISTTPGQGSVPSFPSHITIAPQFPSRSPDSHDWTTHRPPPQNVPRHHQAWTWLPAATGSFLSCYKSLSEGVSCSLARPSTAPTDRSRYRCSPTSATDGRSEPQAYTNTSQHKDLC